MGGLARSTIIVVVTRLFVGVWPPPAVVDELRSLPRPDVPSVRWSTPDQWHVTLRFLGSVPDDDVAAVRASLREVEWTSVRVDVGPATVRFSPTVLALPVTGLDDLAGALPLPMEQPFRGHLTLARARGRSRIPPEVVGLPFAASWTASSFSLVRSQTLSSGAVYDDVDSFLSSDAELMQ